MNNKTRITGGRAGYVRAIDDGFRNTKIINPTVRYSHRRGFFLESRIHPPDDDVLWQALVCWHNGQRFPKAASYQEVRMEILAADRLLEDEE